MSAELGLGSIPQGTDADYPGPPVCQPELPHRGSAKHDCLAHSLPIFNMRSRKPTGDITSPVYEALLKVWSLLMWLSPFPNLLQVLSPGFQGDLLRKGSLVCVGEMAFLPVHCPADHGGSHVI